MKQLEEKVKRTVKYLRVSYQQASGRDRLYLGLYGVLVLVYTWWIMIIF